MNINDKVKVVILSLFLAAALTGCNNDDETQPPVDPVDPVDPVTVAPHCKGLMVKL